ncbi:MAG: molecular chaperone HtpG [Pseudomonadota bacterium]
MTSDTSNEHSFEAEVAQLLKLMVHSVYSNKEIFLRELISNAADACEKLRYLSIEKPELIAPEPDFKILLISDEKENTLSVVDNGIGMDEDDLIANLGTIARSGTKAFMDGLTEKADGSALIGQFGVGFYSAFMVAERVEVFSKKAGGDQTYRWASTGEGTFTIEKIADEDAPDALSSRGTLVKLILSDDDQDYAKPARIENIIRSYSSHIPVPIVLSGSETVTPDDGEEREEAFTRSLSDGSALWTKPKSEISDEDYQEFYRSVSHNFDEPARIIHYRAEGRQEYTVLTFVPREKPFDLFNAERKGRIKLYVRRVFISDDVDILPAWLRFVRGVVDSEDLPLNISRELLQDNPLLETIKTAVTKRVLSELAKMADKETDTYEAVWDAFGPVIKEGLYEDMARRDEIYGLSLFKTSKSDGKWRSLKTYLDGLKENQTAIYYALGDSEEKIKSSPHLEGYKARDIEVLYLSDPVDAFWVRTALGFEGKPFKSITQGADDLETIKTAEDNADASDDTSEDKADLAALYAFLKETLGDDVSDVRASARLAESPVCLIASEGALDTQLQKILKDQPEAAGNMGLNPAPILEVNPNHAMIKKLANHLKTDGDKTTADDMAVLLHGQALILDGEQPKDPAKFSATLGAFMERMLG